MEIAGGVTVSALSVVNALGDVVDESGRILAGARKDGSFVRSTQVILEAENAPIFSPLDNTTLSVVMTDADLDKLQCGIVARMSHDGLARAIDPVHTPVDGDMLPSLLLGRGRAMSSRWAWRRRRPLLRASGEPYGSPGVGRHTGGGRLGRRGPVTAPILRLGTISEIRAALTTARAGGASVGLVPTMGALHEGHLHSVRAARAQNDVVVVSIFVNPTQFGPEEDFERYPRDLDGDGALCAAAGADLIFCPPAEEMYPEPFSTWVDVEDLTDGLCGRSRPGHFRGVCTVVSKLFNICGPDRAYFGEKDVQQLAVVTRMARNLDFPVEIIACPTVREADGLALSSRNARLSPDERAQAPVLYRALTAAGERVRLENEMLRRSIGPSARS